MIDIRQVLAHQRDMRIPTELIPRCPKCGMLLPHFFFLLSSLFAVLAQKSQRPLLRFR